jgi:multimeric flavodoxin WrbA
MLEKRALKVVGLSASPRNGANTDSVVREILAGAADAGAETELVRLGDLDIAPCNACYWCRDNSGCSIEDDMQSVYAALLGADRWIIGTPVYWYTLAAQLKAPLDRIFAWYMDPAGRPTMGMGKKCAIVTLCGDSNAEEQGAPVFEIFDKGLGDYDVEVIARLALTGVSADGAAGHWAGFEPAREIGRLLAR